MAVDLFEIFADDKRLVAYRPQWRAITGSVTATILLQQILFHWDRCGRRPFYKFKEPCRDVRGQITHNLYRPGDSWVEELGFSRAEFDTAIKRIACKLSKRRLQLDPTLKDHDRPVEYYTDEQHLTWYTIHESNFARLLQTLYAVPSAAPNPCEHGECPLKRDSRVRKRALSASGEARRRLQETPDARRSEGENPAFDLTRDCSVRCGGHHALDQFTEIASEIKGLYETTAESALAAAIDAPGGNAAAPGTFAPKGRRAFPPGIEDYIARITRHYGRLCEYPENFSDLCRSDEFYDQIARNPAVLAVLAENLHKASKAGEVKNIVGWARTATREQLKGGRIGQAWN